MWSGTHSETINKIDHERSRNEKSNTKIGPEVKCIFVIGKNARDKKCNSHKHEKEKDLINRIPYSTF